MFEHPYVGIITGRRGSGKTSLGLWLIENLTKGGIEGYIYGAPRAYGDYLPESIDILGIEEIDNLPEDAVIFFDEASIHFFARENFSALNKLIDKLILISRQKDQTLLFASHNLRKLDVGIITDSDVIFFKEPSLLHSKLERAEIRGLTQKAFDAFSKIPQEERKKYTYVLSGDIEAIVETPLPSFWVEDLSYMWRSNKRKGKLVGYACARCGYIRGVLNGSKVCPKCGTELREEYSSNFLE